LGLAAVLVVIEALEDGLAKWKEDLLAEFLQWRLAVLQSLVSIMKLIS
jgi:hypothetical protein